MLFKIAQQSRGGYTIHIMRGVAEFILAFYWALHWVLRCVLRWVLRCVLRWDLRWVLRWDLRWVLRWVLRWDLRWILFYFDPGAAAVIAQGQRLHGCIGCISCVVYSCVIGMRHGH
jgi:hypothetical protein